MINGLLVGTASLVVGSVTVLTAASIGITYALINEVSTRVLQQFFDRDSQFLAFSARTIVNVVLTTSIINVLTGNSLSIFEVLFVAQSAIFALLKIAFLGSIIAALLIISNVLQDQ